MGKENRKERDSFLSKFMYFHEWKNDTCKKYEKGKGDDVQILRDGSRLIPDEITKFIEVQGDIWGKFCGFTDSKQFLSYVCTCTRVSFFQFSRFAFWEKSLATIHIVPIYRQIVHVRFLYYHVLSEKLKTWLFENVLGSIKIIPIYKNVL